MEGDVALLIDGYNLSPAHAGRLVMLAGAGGGLRVRRVYGGTAGLAGWRDATGFRLVHAGAGRNAADMALCIDAVDLACRGGFGTFVIASSDGGFATLALYLRERGFGVTGAGEAKAPDAFRHACSRFVELPGQVAGRLEAADLALRAVILDHGAGGAIAMGVAGALLNTRQGIKASTLPGGGLRAFCARRPDLYAMEAKGPGAMLRWIGPLGGQITPISARARESAGGSASSPALGAERSGGESAGSR